MILEKLEEQAYEFAPIHCFVVQGNALFHLILMLLADTTIHSPQQSRSRSSTKTKQFKVAGLFSCRQIDFFQKKDVIG